MRISRDQVICGVPAFDLRAAFKVLSYGWTSSALEDLLKVTPAEAQSILAELVEAGYVEPEGGQRFRLTLQGGALAAANALKPISRKRAEELVTEVAQRASEINEDEQELYRVSKLWVFGSYLSNAPELGDVDIAFQLDRKDSWLPMPDGEHAYAEGKPPPKSWRGLLHKMEWPRESVLRRLKAKRMHISLHPHTDEVLLSAEKRQIFAG